MAIKPSTAARLRELGKEISALRQEREDLIVKAYREGGTLGQIGRLAGLSHQGVSKMLERLGIREQETAERSALRDAARARGETPD